MEDGWEVLIDGRPVRYFTPKDEVLSDPKPFGFGVLDDRAFRDHPRMRRALTLPSPGGMWLWGYLHWSDGTDLSSLDSEVTAGVASPGRLHGALLVDIHSVACGSCGAILRVASPDAGHLLVTTERLQSHDFHRDCRVCGEPLGLLVAEFVD